MQLSLSTYRSVIIVLTSRVAVVCMFVLCMVTMMPSYSIAQMPSAEEFTVERFATSAEFANTGLLHIAQDRHGFLWLSTYNGVMRYDGRSFRHYPYIPSDTNSIIGPNVIGIIPDSTDHLWVCTSLGLSYMDARTGKAQTFACDELSPYRINRTDFPVITHFANDKSGHLWMSTYHGIARFTIATKEWKWFRIARPPAADREPAFVATYSVMPTPTGVWFGANDGKLFRLDTASGRIDDMRIDIEEPSNIIKCIVPDTDGTLLLATARTGIIRFDPVQQRITGRYLQQEKNFDDSSPVAFYTITLAPDGNQIMVGSNYGAYVLSRNGALLRHYVHDRTKESSLIGNEVTYAFCDRTGVWWFCDDGYGLSKYAPKKIKFYHTKRDEYGTNTLSSNYMRGLLEDTAGNVWAATQYGGLNRYSPTTKRWTLLNKAHPSNRLSNNIWAVYQDHRGVIWTGNRDIKDLLKHTDPMLFSFKNSSAVRAEPFLNAKGLTKVITITEDPEHNLWIGGDGLYRISADRTKFEIVQGKEISQQLHEIQTIVFDRQGMLWCGSLLGGLMQYDRTTKKLRTIPLHHNASPPIAHRDQIQQIAKNQNGTPLDHFAEDRVRVDFVTHITETRDGTLWVVTKGKGLFRYRPATDDFENYTIEQGLPTNVLYAVLESKDGNLWLSSDKGIFVFNPRTQAVRTYNIRDGLQGLEYNRTSFFQSPTGMMYFGGTNGFNSFHSVNVANNVADPNVRILSVQIDSTHIDTPPTDTTITAAFSAHSTIRFEYVSLEFTDPTLTLYQCRLEGFDAGWRTLTERNAVEFINLPVGEYRFAVRARNADGTWSAVPTTIRIVVLPAWWQTWWSLALCIIVGLALMVAIVRWRIQILRKRNEHLEEMVQARTQELREQAMMLEQNNIRLAELNNEKNEILGITAHDLKNPLASIRGLAEMLLEDDAMPRNNVHQALQAIVNSSTRMFDLIKNLLDINAIEQGAIQPHLQSVNINTVVEYVIGEHYAPAEKKAIRIALQEDRQAIAYTDEKLMIQILDNLVSNAIKYSNPNSTITIETYRANHEIVQIHVRDQGLGMTSDDLQKVFRKFQRLSATPTGSESSNGLGLSIVKNLVQAVNGTVAVHSAGKNMGTTFTVTLPSADSVQVAAE